MAAPITAPVLSREEFLAGFERFEQQLQAFFGVFTSNKDPDHLAQVAIELQQITLVFAALIRRLPAHLQFDAALQRRARRIASQLASLREGLVRQTALVSQALGTLLPQTQSSTYAPAAGLQRRSPYASIQNSGEIRSMSA